MTAIVRVVNANCPRQLEAISQWCRVVGEIQVEKGRELRPMEAVNGPRDSNFTCLRLRHFLATFVVMPNLQDAVDAHWAHVTSNAHRMCLARLYASRSRTATWACGGKVDEQERDAVPEAMQLSTICTRAPHVLLVHWKHSP